MQLNQLVPIDCVIILLVSLDQQDVNGVMTKTSNEINEKQQPKVVQQTAAAIKKAKD